MLWIWAVHSNFLRVTRILDKTTCAFKVYIGQEKTNSVMWMTIMEWGCFLHQLLVQVNAIQTIRNMETYLVFNEAQSS